MFFMALYLLVDNELKCRTYICHKWSDMLKPAAGFLCLALVITYLIGMFDHYAGRNEK